MPDVPVEDTHTYTAHLMFRARDDEHARRIAAQIKHLVESWQESIDAEQDEPLMMTPNGYAVEAAHLTDADDWAEHVGVEDVCCRCDGPGTNRSRVGNGYRVCPACVPTAFPALPYNIEDVQI